MIPQQICPTCNLPKILLKLVSAALRLLVFMSEHSYPEKFLQLFSFLTCESIPPIIKSLSNKVKSCFAPETG